MDIETLREMQKHFKSGDLNFPVGTHESVAKVLGLDVETVKKIREKRNEEARQRVKTREMVDSENIKYTLWDNRGCDLMQPGNRLTIGQLKSLIANLPDNMDVYTHQYVANVGMEALPCETIKIANSYNFSKPEEKHNIMVVE